MLDAPNIDNRSRDQIFAILAESLQTRLGIDVYKSDPFTAALLQVFSRYSELIIERLNKVPEKNFDAFLNILKTSRIPPTAARASLTFTPVKRLPASGSTNYIPAATKVAAPPGEGETEPVVFETTRNLNLTNITLKKLYSLDPLRGLYTDKSILAAMTPQTPTADFLFTGRDTIPHELYLAHSSIFSMEKINKLRLTFTIANQGVSPLPGQHVQWFIPSEDGHIPLAPITDTTSQLSQSGEVVFENLPEWPTCEIFDRTSHWLCCRFLDPVKLPVSQINIDSPLSMPAIEKTTISASWSEDETPIESALWNTIPLDLSKDFFPLGEVPRFGDVFYLQSPAFARANTAISLIIKMTNPTSAGKNSPLPAVDKSGKPLVHWESWDGRRWKVLDHQDGTEAFTKDGNVSFTIPSDFTPATVNGLEAPWIRARLVSGNYGGDGQISSQTTPPSIQLMHFTSSLTSGPAVPEHLVTNTHFSFNTISKDTSFSVFHQANQLHRAFYLGFMPLETEPTGVLDASIDLYFHIGEYEGRLFFQTGALEPPVELVWQYWNGNDWLDLQVDDGTESLTVSGIVHIRTPEDIVPWHECSFGYNFEKNGDSKAQLHWLRVLWIKGEYNCRPRTSRVLLNTVPAVHTNTIVNEILGSSNGLPNQIFSSARRPPLQDLELEIVEPAIPSEEELITIRQQDGDSALTVIRDRQGNIEKVRVPWSEVDDFLTSGNSARHFVVDRQKGAFLFGDGINGLIPPPGTNNVRLRKYKTGGGSSGNKPAGSITQLRNSVLYVDSVINLEAAVGGQDTEDWASVRRRGTRQLRHRDRAVTLEDYQDLAMLAAPTVAKAKCIPNRDLSIEGEVPNIKAGVVSLIVVPHSHKPKPTPDAALLRRVSDFINERRMPEVELILLEPEYLEITLEVVVIASAKKTGINLVELCRLELDKFLHPLTGGFQGRGWDFGQLPRESDFYALLESIEGLESVRSLQVKTEEVYPGILRNELYLSSSGQHKINLDW
ncbi:MAG: putative baseplate assembly protein [Desulfobulbaceae bacterium]|nr:putative baseplate assembly protein [Desulfobulbaceae bacterium]